MVLEMASQIYSEMDCLERDLLGFENDLITSSSSMIYAWLEMLTMTQFVTPSRKKVGKSHMTRFQFRCPV